MSELNPREELEALATGLAAQFERARRRGIRRVLAPAPTRTASEAPSSQAQAPPPSTKPTGPPQDQAAGCSSLEELQQAVAACRACRLCETRTQTVFSDGRGSSGVMFIGEAPGADEDASGVPFVGRAGQLLSDIVTKGMKMSREEVYIANVLKCRPPGNRDPEPTEKELCTHFLDRQIDLVNPKVIIPLGKHAAQHVLKSDLSMGRMRGRVHLVGGRQVVPTYHPAFLLRSPHMKKDCWQDIQLALKTLAEGS